MPLCFYRKFSRTLLCARVNARNRWRFSEPLVKNFGPERRCGTVSGGRPQNASCVVAIT